MTIPAGTGASTLTYADRIENLIKSLTAQMREYHERKKEIKDDPDYTIKERQAALDNLTKNYRKPTQQAANEIEELWDKIKKEYKVPGAGSVSQETTVNTLTLFLNSDAGMMNAEIFDNIIKQIENDYLAVSTVYNVIDKQGLAEYFRDTKANSVLQGAVKLKETLKAADSVYKDLGFHYNNMEQNSMSVSISTRMFIDLVRRAENIYFNLRELTK